jgi:hypothetical protein
VDHFPPSKRWSVTVRAYVDHWNEHPPPFVWTKEPADIKAVRQNR